jgi:hypothetical protein
MSNARLALPTEILQEDGQKMLELAWTIEEAQANLKVMQAEYARHIVNLRRRYTLKEGDNVDYHTCEIVRKASK